MAPNNPKRAPDAPTDMVGLSDGLRLRVDNKLPPMPESTYRTPILTEKSK